MPKPNLSDLTTDETQSVLSECVGELTFDQVWDTLMESWDKDDKEEAYARLAGMHDTDSMNDC